MAARDCHTRRPAPGRSADLDAAFPELGCDLFAQGTGVANLLQPGQRDEHVFPVGFDANKLALFEQMVSGELDEIHGLHFKKVKARVAMDTEKTTEALETNLPMEIAEKIVASALSED